MIESYHTARMERVKWDNVLIFFTTLVAGNAEVLGWKKILLAPNV